MATFLFGCKSRIDGLAALDLPKHSGDAEANVVIRAACGLWWEGGDRKK
jgi:hypothetical protein